MSEGCKISGASEARGSGAGGVAAWRNSDRGRPAWGETMKPTGGAGMAVTEGEGVVAGLRKLEEETAFGKSTKAALTGMGRAHARGLQEKRGGRWGWLGGEAGWAGWPLGRLGRM
jgi:hypothetical protein